MLRHLSKVLLLASLFSFQASLGQALKLNGIVTDASTGKPVPYVNIGLEGLGVGTVSDGGGSFQLIIPENYGSKPIVFSKLGYKNKSYTYDIILRLGMQVKLSAGSSFFSSFMISQPTSYKSPCEEADTFQIREYQPIDLGAIISSRILISSGLGISRIRLAIDSCSFEEAKFRFKIYKAIKKEPGQLIKISDPISINKNSEEFLWTLDEQLDIPGDIFIGLELIEVSGRSKRGSVLYLKTLEQKTGQLAMRATSMDKWELEKQISLCYEIR